MQCGSNAEELRFSSKTFCRFSIFGLKNESHCLALKIYGSNEAAGIKTGSKMRNQEDKCTEFKSTSRQKHNEAGGGNLYKNENHCIGLQMCGIKQSRRKHEASGIK